MSTDAKLNKTQISKIIQSSGSFGSWLVNLASNVKTNFERQISEKRSCRSRKNIYFIYFE